MSDSDGCVPSSDDFCPGERSLLSLVEPRFTDEELARDVPQVVGHDRSRSPGTVLVRADVDANDGITVEADANGGTGATGSGGFRV